MKPHLFLSAALFTLAWAGAAHADDARIRQLRYDPNAVTRIDANFRVCVETDFCTNRVGSTQCSAVIFGPGHTTADRLEGFTITNGRGIIQTQKVAGGGIFVFSSPTIIFDVRTFMMTRQSEAQFFMSLNRRTGG